MSSVNRHNCSPSFPMWMHSISFPLSVCSGVDLWTVVNGGGESGIRVFFLVLEENSQCLTVKFEASFHIRPLFVSVVSFCS